MSKLEEAYASLQEDKKKRRDLAKMFKDELSQNERHKEVVEKLKELRDEKKSIENEVKASTPDYQEMDDLRIEILSANELISDLALNMYMNQETVEIVDENDTKWYPQFKVSFKKE